MEASAFERQLRVVNREPKIEGERWSNDRRGVFPGFTCGGGRISGAIVISIHWPAVPYD